MNTQAPSMAALSGEVVTERHAEYCRENGHATRTVDGEMQEDCPRCGAFLNDRPTITVRATTVNTFGLVTTGGRRPGSNYGTDTRKWWVRYDRQAGVWISHTPSIPAFGTARNVRTYHDSWEEAVQYMLLIDPRSTRGASVLEILASRHAATGASYPHEGPLDDVDPVDLQDADRSPETFYGYNV